MQLKENVKRMDSLMAASRCKRMSRLEILYTVNANAVCLLNLQDPSDPDAVFRRKAGKECKGYAGSVVMEFCAYL